MKELFAMLNKNEEPMWHMTRLSNGMYEVSKVGEAQVFTFHSIGNAMTTVQSLNGVRKES